MFTEDERVFFSLLNQYRASRGLQPVQMSIALTNASRWMSNDMAVNNYFSHTDSLGRSSFARMDAYRYDYPTWRGENLAAGNSDGVATFIQWRCSSGHNANMLRAEYRVIGLARFARTSSQYRFYWTNKFGGVVDATVAVPDPSPMPTLPTPSC